MDYRQINAKMIDTWCRNGWEWGVPLTHEAYAGALAGQWDVFLTPARPVPHAWFGALRGKTLLGLASGGGQQIPVFAALGARCTVLDFSAEQCRSERLVARREGYRVQILQRDMTRPFPFADGTFDLIFHPVSNCYIEKVEPVFRECYRVLKRGGALLCGLDIGINYAFDDDETQLVHSLPFNPLRDEKLFDECIRNGWGIQFSHTLEEQLGGQLKAGFRLTDLYEDTNGSGRLRDLCIPSFVATRAVKE